MQPTALPDPNLSVLEHLYSSGAFFCLGILLLFFGARWLTKHWPWLATGQRHVWAVAFIGGLATLIVPATQGTTPNTNMLVMVVVTMVGISSDPKKIAALTSTLALVLVLSNSGCSWTKQEARVVKTAAVDCTKGEEAKAVKLFSPMLDQLLLLATGGDGNLDTSQLEGATKQLAGDIGGCVLATSIAKAMNPPPPQPGSPQSSPLVIDRNSAAAYFESVRATRLAGTHYLTEAGPL